MTKYVKTPVPNSTPTNRIAASHRLPPVYFDKNVNNFFIFLVFLVVASDKKLFKICYKIKQNLQLAMKNFFVNFKKNFR